MSSEYLGRGDARRSLALLWGVQRKATRGRRPGTSVEAIVRAAVEVADADGLAALSMRRVADRLGLGTMSIYTYVPTKAELLDLMVDAVNGELADQLEAIVAGGVDPEVQALRPALEAVARATWDLHLRHPWLLQVAASRAVLGPNETRVLESLLRIVDGLGLTGREMVAVVDAIGTYVRGAVRAAAEAVQAPEATGKTDTEWWLERAPMLEEMDVYNVDRFPTVARVSAAGGFDIADDVAEYTLQFALEDFEFGLQRLLDGIEAFVERRAARDPDQASEGT